MDRALWVSIFGADDDGAQWRKHDGVPLFDPLFPYQAAGHSADRLVRGLEHDALIQKILGDAPQAQPIAQEERVPDSFDTFVKSLIHSFQEPGHLEKIQSRAAELIKRAAEGKCKCTCRRCSAFQDCTNCQAEEKCQGWLDSIRARDTDLTPAATTLTRHIKNLASTILRFKAQLAKVIGQRWVDDHEQDFVRLLSNVAKCVAEAVA